MVQVCSLWMGLDRYWLLYWGLNPRMPVHYIVMGTLRTTMSILVAHAAWKTMTTYRKFRTGNVLVLPQKTAKENP